MSGLESSKRLDPVQRPLEEGRGKWLTRDPCIVATALDVQEHGANERRAVGDWFAELADVNKCDPLAALGRNPDDPFVGEWTGLYLTRNPHETPSFQSHQGPSGHRRRNRSTRIHSFHLSSFALHHVLPFVAKPISRLAARVSEGHE